MYNAVSYLKDLAPFSKLALMQFFLTPFLRWFFLERNVRFETPTFLRVSSEKGIVVGFLDGDLSGIGLTHRSTPCYIVAFGECDFEYSNLFDALLAARSFSLAE